MAPKNRQRWKLGDVFLIGLKDGKKVVGQIVGHEPTVLNSASCAFFNWRVESVQEVEAAKTMPDQSIFSVLFVSRDLLDNGCWRIVANRPITLRKELLPHENFRRIGYVGAKIIGSGIVNEFVNAFFGLVPWDDWKDPHYLDNLLISPDKNSPSTPGVEE